MKAIEFSPFEMATLRIKRTLAAVNKDSQEEHLKNNVSHHTNFPRINGDYITQVLEKIEGRVIKKLAQKFSRTKVRTLDGLSKLN